MKRDWDLIREQLTAIEQEQDLFSGVPEKPKWESQNWDVYEKQLREFRTEEGKIFGHLELLIKAGYIEGIEVMRSIDGSFHYGVTMPRLTMAGHDLLDTMRSDSIWNKVKATAKSKGIELTFDTIKLFASLALQAMMKG